MHATPQDYFASLAIPRTIGGGFATTVFVYTVAYTACLIFRLEFDNKATLSVMAVLAAAAV